ncbi:MAG: ATP-binding protein, partial [Pirellulaceae bacterium]
MLPTASRTPDNVFFVGLMMSDLPAYELLGKFYLGRTYDLETRQLKDEDLLYDSKDLVTHAMCVGMTGSGKTGLCLSLLEEAAIDEIPAICIDPKGDLGNLLLTFPALEANDFKPWLDADEAARKGVTLDELAVQTAATWKQGLAKWDQDGTRVQRFK